MKLTKKEVEHVALLARLKISEAEKDLFLGQLSSILNYVGQLQEINTDNVLETSQVTGIKNALREDAIEDSSKGTRERILKNAPEIEDDLIKTKCVFE